MAKSFTAWEFLAEIYGGDLPPAASERRYDHKEWQPAIDALAEGRYFAKGRASIGAVLTEIVAHLWREGGLCIDPYLDVATNGAPYTYTAVRFYRRPDAADRPLPSVTRAELRAFMEDRLKALLKADETSTERMDEAAARKHFPGQPLHRPWFGELRKTLGYPAEWSRRGRKQSKTDQTDN